MSKSENFRGKRDGCVTRIAVVLVGLSVFFLLIAGLATMDPDLKQGAQLYIAVFVLFSLVIGGVSFMNWVAKHKGEAFWGWIILWFILMVAAFAAVGPVGVVFVIAGVPLIVWIFKKSWQVFISYFQKE